MTSKISPSLSQFFVHVDSVKYGIKTPIGAFIRPLIYVVQLEKYSLLAL